MSSQQEKAEAMKTLQSIRTKFQDRETKITKDYQNKFDTVEENLKNMCSKMEEKMEKCMTVNANLKSELEKARNSGSAGMQELRDKYEKEISDLVTSSNEKYQNMLVEQMAAQEQIRDELTSRFQEEKDALRAELRDELEQEMGQLRAKLHGEKEEALIQQRQEYEDKLQVGIHDHAFIHSSTNLQFQTLTSSMLCQLIRPYSSMLCRNKQQKVQQG